MANFLITNSYNAKENIKMVGGVFDKNLKGWVVNQAQLDLLEDRAKSGISSMGFDKIWRRCKIEQLKDEPVNATSSDLPV